MLSGVNVVDIQRLSQIALGVIDTAAVQIPGQQHHIEQMGIAVEVGRSGTLVLLSGVQSGGDDGLGIDVVIAEVVRGVSALKLLLGGVHIHGVVDGVQVVIVPDRADVLLIDLVLVALLTAVADHDGHRQLLVQRLAHHAVLVLHHIEIGDVDLVIPVHASVM